MNYLPILLSYTDNLVLFILKKAEVCKKYVKAYNIDVGNIMYMQNNETINIPADIIKYNPSTNMFTGDVYLLANPIKSNVEGPEIEVSNGKEGCNLATPEDFMVVRYSVVVPKLEPLTPFYYNKPVFADGAVLLHEPVNYDQGSLRDGNHPLMWAIGYRPPNHLYQPSIFMVTAIQAGDGYETRVYPVDLIENILTVVEFNSILKQQGIFVPYITDIHIPIHHRIIPI